MPRLDEVRRTLLDALHERYGAPPTTGSGPVDAAPPFESLVRAGLGLVAEPRVASAVLATLRDSGLLEPEALASVDPLELETLFQTSRIRLAPKALQPLQRVARWVAGHVSEPGSFAVWTTESLREAWRGLNGVGPSTADALLLRGLGRSTYPVDRPTFRILVRHGWLETTADYDEARSVAEEVAPGDPEGLIQLSHAFERLGREHCKPSVARCDRCPLQPLLPPGGPIAPEE